MGQTGSGGIKINKIQTLLPWGWKVEIIIHENR